MKLGKYIKDSLLGFHIFFFCLPGINQSPSSAFSFEKQTQVSRELKRSEKNKKDASFTAT